MFETFEELAVGTTFYQVKPFVGVVELEIIEEEGNQLTAKSVGPKGYLFDIDEDLFYLLIEHNRALYKTKEVAQEARLKQEAEQKQAFIDQFKNDKESFVEEMIRLAYLGEIEHDYVKAKAIENVANIHYPSIDFDNIYD